MSRPEPGICLCGAPLEPNGRCSVPGCVASPPARTDEWETGATTHAVNDTVLTIVNDGDGETCGGYDYRLRVEAGRTGALFAFRDMARAYSRYRHQRGSPGLTRAEVLEAAELLLTYYRDHAAEVDKP